MGNLIPENREGCKLSNFTFRKDRRESGLSGVGNPYPSTQIKHKGKWCGTIHAPNWRTKDGCWHIGLMIKDANDRGGWRWAFFKKRFPDEPSARDWLKKNHIKIFSQYTIHTVEP